MNKLLTDASKIFGEVKPPPAISKYSSDPGLAIGTILDIVLKLLVVGAGIYTLINLVLAGYSFLSAGEDPKKIAGAWSRIWQSALGLAVTAGSFTLAAIFGKLIFGNWNFILKPVIPTL